jgi:hypothetical protein
MYERLNDRRRSEPMLHAAGRYGGIHPPNDGIFVHGEEVRRDAKHTVGYSSPAALSGLPKVSSLIQSTHHTYHNPRDVESVQARAATVPLPRKGETRLSRDGACG